MGGREKPTPILLKRLLSPPLGTGSDTPTSSGTVAKRPSSSGERESESSCKRQKQLKGIVDAVVQAVSTDRSLSSVLNVAVHEVDSEVMEAAGLKGRLALVTTKKVHYHKPAGYTSRVRLVIENGGSYCIQVLFKIVEEGQVSTVEEIKRVCNKLADPAMKFCPGIPPEEYQSFMDAIGYGKKGVQIVEEPFHRVSNYKCQLWFHMPRSGYSREKKRCSEVLCHACVTLRSMLRADVKRVAKVTPEEKVKREQADSMFPMKYLPPESLQRRMMNIRRERLKQCRIIKKFISRNSSNRDADTSQIESILEDLGSSDHELESFFANDKNLGTKIGSTLRQALEGDNKSTHNVQAQESSQTDQESNS